MSEATPLLGHLVAMATKQSHALGPLELSATKLSSYWMAVDRRQVSQSPSIPGRLNQLQGQFAGLYSQTLRVSHHESRTNQPRVGFTFLQPSCLRAEASQSHRKGQSIFLSVGVSWKDSEVAMVRTGTQNPGEILGPCCGGAMLNASSETLIF